MTDIKRSEVAGVILDSGGVMIRPVQGDWGPTWSLEEVLAERGIPWQREQRAAALAAGSAYLDIVRHIRLRDQQAERAVMARYHQTVLAAVGVTAHGPALAREIQRREELRLSVEPYEWTVPVLVELAARAIPVVVLSNAWPSLRRLHRGLGLDRYVRAMVISGEEGVSKPDERIFRRALAELGLPPARVVFVDDWPGHIEAANGLGLRGVWLRPPTADPAPHLETITDLRALLPLLA